MTDWIDELPPDLRETVVGLSGRADFPFRLAQLAGAMRALAAGTTHHHDELARRAREMAPYDHRIRVVTERSLRKSVPNWHFSLIRDHRRNSVYEQALLAAVTPQSIVLEIGTGSGILAMLAARAGAAHVYTCEAEPMVARAARENVARNGYQDRVTVIAERSDNLVVGRHLPVRADVLVSEVVDNGLLGEDVLAIMEDAQARLLAPGAVILPGVVGLRGALVGGEQWTRGCRMPEAEGFNLSAFDPLAPPVVSVGASLTLDDALSDDVEVLRFDFDAASSFPPEDRTISVRARRDGVADGLLHWLRLEFTDDIVYDNRPPTEDSAWRPMLHLFPEPLRVSAGELILLHVRQERKSVTIWPEPAVPMAMVTTTVGATAHLAMSSVPSRHPGVVDAMVGDDKVLLGEHDLHYHALDSVGLLVWDLLDGSRSVSDICAKVEAEYAVEPADCARDVLAFLEDLAANGLVVLA